MRTAGVAEDVQWLLTAGDGDTHLVTASLAKEKKNADRGAFQVLSHMAVPSELKPSMARLMTGTLASNPAALIAHAADATPIKRLRDITSSDSSGEAPAEMALATRRRLE